eukprot:GHVP01049412.1.p1 GENE.GHVP01049412.1~~GHVP01049412.1.p1  ORF type:complete len:393 (+),score=65.43 GHVP01049412.1:955-2133(+)
MKFFFKKSLAQFHLKRCPKSAHVSSGVSKKKGKMNSFFLIYFLVLPLATSLVHILSAAGEECSKKFLPFQSTCVEHCPGVNDKPQCLLQFLETAHHLPDEELIFYADNDVLFTDWYTEEELYEFLNSKFGIRNNVLFGAEGNSYPTIYKNKKPVDGPYLNAGVFIGPKKLVIELLRAVDKMMTAYYKIGISDGDNFIPQSLYMKKENDQGFFGIFYFETENGPIVLDKKRELGYVQIDVTRYYLHQTLADKMMNIKPRCIRFQNMPGEDVCPYVKGGKVIKILGRGMCATSCGKQKNCDCPNILKLEGGCNFVSNFYKHPLGVLVEATDRPLFVHFAGKRVKPSFYRFLTEQSNQCKNRFKYQKFYFKEPESNTKFIEEYSNSILRRFLKFL